MTRGSEKKRHPECRIGHVVQNLGIGGLERIVVSLIDNVDPDRFLSSVYCLEDGGELMADVLQKGHEATALGKKPGIDFRLPFRLARMFRRSGLDIVHCHNFGGLFYGSIAGSLTRNASVVYTAHGPVFPHRRRHAWFQRLPIVDRVITVSDFVRRSAINEAGLRTDKVITIANGIDVASLASCVAPETARHKANMGFGVDDPVIGLVARLSPEKNHTTLIEAFGRVVQEIDTARLVLVGAGELREKLRDQVRQMGLADSVKFIGEQKDIGAILSVFDVFALPSKEEGLGITLLEAMAVGVPVVATRVGGIPEIVEDGVTGKMVPPGDPAKLAEAILWVLKNPGEAMAMTEKARDLVTQRFGIEQMTAKYEEVYWEIHNKKG
ncbi:MAG: glycosyltransferase [Candidatus Latescibacterota bacterium]|nr:MAG: glycosyltransferase [Candidatus Latescibacterota bacterium]